MSNSVQLMVFRRAGRLLVVPGILTETGFRSLDDLVSVEQPDELAGAVQEGVERARAAYKLPPGERLHRAAPFWEAAGGTWKDFVPGTTAVELILHDEGVSARFMSPDPTNDHFQRMALEKDLPPGTQSSVLARTVVGLFDEADRTHPPRWNRRTSTRR